MGGGRGIKGDQKCILNFRCQAAQRKGVPRRHLITCADVTVVGADTDRAPHLPPPPHPPPPLSPMFVNRNRTLFIPRADAPRVYVRAWTLCCFHSLISTQTFRRALTESVDICTEIKSAPFRKVWRKVPESNAYKLYGCLSHAYTFIN